jgi:putative FmdB family regulatory protein
LTLGGLIPIIEITLGFSPEGAVLGGRGEVQMPIYEFYCPDCNTIYNFFSSRVDTEKRPHCPKCPREQLDRILSPFATVKRSKGEGEDDFPLPDLDEERMERAMAALASEAESLDEDDPRQAARLMRKLSDMTGLNLGPAMEEAIERMEAGQDPEEIEEEMGDLLEEADPAQLFQKKGGKSRKKAPKVDETLYSLD